MGQLHDLLDGVHAAQDVGHVRQGHELGAAVGGLEELLEVAEVVGLCLRVQPHEVQEQAVALGEQLPGHEVAVVLHHRQDDLVARPEVRGAPGVGHEVDGLGRAAREDDLLAPRRAHELLDLGACALVAFRRAVREEVRPAVHVRVRLEVVVVQRVQHHSGLLRGRRRVEVQQRLAVLRRLREDRKLALELLREGRGGGRGRRGRRRRRGWVGG